MAISDRDDDNECIGFDELHSLEFPTISGVEGGGDAITSTYGISASPTYILIAPDHTIVEQDMWPLASAQTLIDYFEGHGIQEASCDQTLTAVFTSDVTEVCESNDVSFSDASVGSVTSWSWTFAGGDPATSTEQNPTVIYNSTGTYDVELEVSDGTETNSVLMEDYISVNAIPEVELQAFDDVCVGWPEFELTGGSPAGGVYSGTGVENGMFDPGTAGIGTHTVSYTYMENNCENSMDQDIYVDACTGITESDEIGLNIFPNPTNGEFELQINYSGVVTIRVYNMLGVSVYEQEENASGKFTKSMDLNGMENGIYFISIQTDDKSYGKKIKLLNN
jgi:PKD repeat protein